MPKNDVKYRLTWSGRKDHPALHAAVKHLKTFPLFKDSEAKLIDYARYMELVETHEIDAPQSYWRIRKNEIGLISLADYRKYSKTWDSINIAQSDFIAGWLASEKQK